MMDRVSDLLPVVLRKRGLHTPVEASFVVTTAQRWLTDHLPSLVSELHATTFRDGTLTVRADNPIALAEGSLLKASLLKELQRSCASAAVREVRFVRSR